MKTDQRREFSEGWPVLLAATLGVSVATTAIPFYSMGVFIRPLEVARGWSRSEIAFAASLLSFILPLAILWLGKLIDRFGVRSIAVSGHVMLGLCYLALSSGGSDIRIFWAIYAVAAITAVGASPITYTRAVIQCFDRNRGLAIGICMSGAGVSAAIAPATLEWVIRTHGIASGYQALAATLFAVAMLVFFLLPNTRTAVPLVEVPPSGEAISTMQAGRDRPYLALSVICIGIFAVALSINGYVIHMVPLLEAQGLSSQEAAKVVTSLGLAVIAGRLVTGYSLDRISTGLICTAVLSGTVCGIWLLYSGTPSVAPLAAALIGFAIGAEVDVVAYLMSRVFTKEAFPRYFSFAYASFMLGAGISPLLAAQSFERHGDYTLFFLFSSGLLTTMSAACLALHVRVGAFGKQQE